MLLPTANGVENGEDFVGEIFIQGVGGRTNNPQSLTLGVRSKAEIGFNPTKSLATVYHDIPFS